MNNRLRMNCIRSPFYAVGLLALLAVALTLTLAPLGPGVAGQPGQSPVSPLPDLPRAPESGLAAWIKQLLAESFWMSPLPWAAIGLVLFSALAWALVFWFRRTRPADPERKEPPRPPQWTP